MTALRSLNLAMAARAAAPGLDFTWTRTPAVVLSRAKLKLSASSLDTPAKSGRLGMRRTDERSADLRLSDRRRRLGGLRAGQSPECRSEEPGRSEERRVGK